MRLIHFVMWRNGELFMDSFIAITKALAEKNRVRILLALEGRELCACQIIELLELAPSTVSKHMSVLRQARLVEGRKDGRWMFYRLAGSDAPEGVKETLIWVRRSLSKDPRVRSDTKKLKHILKIHPEELCRIQNTIKPYSKETNDDSKAGSLRSTDVF